MSLALALLIPTAVDNILLVGLVVAAQGLFEGAATTALFSAFVDAGLVGAGETAVLALIGTDLKH